MTGPVERAYDAVAVRGRGPGPPFGNVSVVLGPGAGVVRVHGDAAPRVVTRRAEGAVGVDDHTAVGRREGKLPSPPVTGEAVPARPDRSG